MGVSSGSQNNNKATHRVIPFVKLLRVSCTNGIEINRQIKVVPVRV